jgi:hypothetical protein
MVFEMSVGKMGRDDSIALYGFIRFERLNSYKNSISSIEEIYEN